MTGRLSLSAICTGAGSPCKLNSASSCVHLHPKSILGVRGVAMLARHVHLLVCILKHATCVVRACNFNTTMQMWNGWKALLQPKTSLSPSFYILMQCFLKQQVHSSLLAAGRHHSLRLLSGALSSSLCYTHSLHLPSQ